MEEGDFQFQPGISVRFTASPESPDIDWDGLDQIPILGDISSPEVAMDASSSHRLPSFFASPSIFASDATTTTAATNTFLSQPNTCSSQPGAGVAHDMASEGAVVDLDSDLLEQLLPGDNPWPELATNDSISSSSFASRSTVPLDATTNWGTPASTNTCLIQPSIPVPRTTSSEDAAVDADHLLEQPRSLSSDNPWPELATDASNSLILIAARSTFPSHAETTMASARSNTCILWSGVCSSVRKRVTQALAYIRETQRDNHVFAHVWGPSFAIDHRSDNLIPCWSILRIKFFMGVGSLFMEYQDLESFTTKYQVPMPMPTVNLVKDLDVRGALRVPVFEKGNHSCFGIIDLISTTDKLNFTSELDTICSALQAVNLTITPFSSISRTKKLCQFAPSIPRISSNPSREREAPPRGPGRRRRRHEVLEANPLGLVVVAAPPRPRGRRREVLR